MADLMGDILFVSVVIPTYNRKELLRVTLDALGRQTYPQDCFEVIVVSDGSSDGTEQMVTERAGAVPYRLRCIRQENQGVARARNRGIGEAVGEVLFFVDDDIEVVPEFLAAHAAHHACDQTVAIVGTIAADPRRRRLEPPWIAWEHAMLERNYRRWTADRAKGPGPDHFYTGNASVRREHVLRVGGFDESLNRQEDMELAYRLERACGVHFGFEPTAVGIHRPNRGLSSWLDIAYGYGRLDVECARAERVPWDRVRDYYRMCSCVTRFLGRATLSLPIATAPLRWLLLTGAGTCFRMRLSGPSLAALSVVYNLRYLEGARDQLGSHEEMRRLLAGRYPWKHSETPRSWPATDREASLNRKRNRGRQRRKKGETRR